MAEENKKTLQQEKEELELEQLRDDVQKKRAAREMRRQTAQDNEKTYKDAALREREDQARCNHKKGGRDYAGLQHRGDGENHSIIGQQHPMGYMTYLCSRCLFYWEPGVTAKYMKDGKTPNPTGISYQEAGRLPTDNTPAGSVVFGPKINIPAA